MDKKIILLLIGLVLIIGCTGKAMNKISGAGLHKVNLKFEGMSCPSCALGVEYQLKQLNGVEDAKVEYPAGTGFAVYDVSKVSVDEIAKASTVYPAIVVNDEVYGGKK